MPSTPLQEIKERIRKLQEAMINSEIDAALIVQRVDLFYFSGTGQDGHLFIPAPGEPQLLIRKSYERAVDDSPLKEVLPVKSFSNLKNHVLHSSSRKIKKIGMELDLLPVNNYRAYQSLFQETEIVDISPLVREIRMIKSPYELEFMLQAARLNDQMFAGVSQYLEEGITEVELAGRIESFYRKHGHQGIVRVRSFNSEVFYGHVMSGANLAVPSCSVGPTGGMGINASMPQGAGLRTIGRNEPVQIDYVAVVNGYIIDQARTFYLGDPAPEFLKIHQCALKVQDSLAQMGGPGVECESMYDAALEVVAEAGLSDGFMGHPQPVPFVGHGIGLELDELPVIGRKSPHILQTGMVIALEPKFIVPGKGLAGIENSFLVTETGLKKLTLFDDEIQIVS